MTKCYSKFLSFLNLLFSSITSPHPSITDKEEINKIRFCLSFLLIALIIDIILLLIRISTLNSVTNLYHIVLPITSIVLVSIIFFIGKSSSYYRVAFILFTCLLLIFPWIQLPSYINNINADQILFSPSFVLAIGILYASFLFSNRIVIILFLVSSLNILLFYFFYLNYPLAWIPIKILFLLFITAISLSILRIKNDLFQSHIQVEKDVQKLLTEVVDEFIPICSYCKSIKDSNNEWVSLEMFIHHKSKKILFTHSICTNCKKKFENGLLEQREN